MPSEKAKENKTLTANCASCGKTFSTEMLNGVIVGHGRGAKLVSVCETCLAKGFKAADGAALNA